MSLPVACTSWVAFGFWILDLVFLAGSFRFVLVLCNSVLFLAFAWLVWRILVRIQYLVVCGSLWLLSEYIARSLEGEVTVSLGLDRLVKRLLIMLHVCSPGILVHLLAILMFTTTAGKNRARAWL